MSRLLEFILGSILITVFTVAFLFFSAVHYVLRGNDIADCIWYASARTWIDSNGNGQPDPWEPPLDAVRIHVEDRRSQLINISWPVITDDKGHVQLNVSIPGCTDTVFEIYVDIPEGYRITTMPRLAVQPELWESRSQEPVYYFGFVPER